MAEVRTNKTLLLRAALSCCGVGMLLMAGCASPSARGALTLKQTQLNVDWKMTAYQQAVTFGSVTEGQAQQVATAHKEYQAAFQQALAQAHGNLDAPTPPKLGQLATRLIGVIESVLSTITSIDVPQPCTAGASGLKCA